MRISKEQYYKTMAKALLKGYFRGLREGRRQKKVLKARWVRCKLITQYTGVLYG
jgi:hypothetical protein